MPLEESEQLFSVGASMGVGSGDSSTTASPNMIPGSSISVTTQVPMSSITVQPQGMDQRLSGQSGLQPEIGVYPLGDDSHILHRQQVQAGTPLPQGPHGPMVPKPRPASFPVNQTPTAPQVVQPIDLKPGASFSPISRGGATGQPLQGSSHQNLGPGNYNPPLDTSPHLDGEPGSGQQLIKTYLMHAKEQANKIHAQKQEQQQKQQLQQLKQQQQQQQLQQQLQQLQQQQQLRQQQQQHQPQQQSFSVGASLGVSGGDQQQQQMYLQQQFQDELQRQMIINSQMNMVQQQQVASPQSPMSQHPTKAPHQKSVQPQQIPSNVLMHR